MKPNSPHIREIGEKEFKLEVLGSGQPVLVAFLAPWSRPCQKIRSTLKQVAAACGERLRLAIVNVDDYPDLGVWYDIQSIPTVLCFVGESERARIVGTASLRAVMSKLEPVIGARKPAGPVGTAPAESKNL